MKDLFEIGIIAGVHGVRGDLKVFPNTQDPENLSNQEFFIIEDRKVSVDYARVQGKFIVVHLKGVDDRDKAMELKGRILSIPRENAAPLPQGMFYMEDLMGCSVYEDGKFLGNVKDIMETGANDVYSVIDNEGRELLIPAIKDVLLNIDIEESRIDVRLPEGLLDGDYV